MIIFQMIYTILILFGWVILYGVVKHLSDENKKIKELEKLELEEYKNNFKFYTIKK